MVELQLIAHWGKLRAWRSKKEGKTVTQEKTLRNASPKELKIHYDRLIGKMKARGNTRPMTRRAVQKLLEFNPTCSVCTGLNFGP